MYHSTMVLLTGGDMVYLHGSCAVSPFTASTVGVTSTFTDARHTVKKKRDILILKVSF